MCNLIKILILISLTANFTACKKELDINAKWKDIPIVYCILKPNDTVQYLRLGRTFQASSNYHHSALQVDSVQYKPEEVKVIINKIENGNSVGHDIIFESTTEIKKDTGLFTQQEYYLFSTHERIHGNSEYKLTIIFSKQNKILTSSIKTLSDISVLEPNMIVQRKIDFTNLHGYSVQWETVPGASIYKVLIKFKYCEITPSKDSVNKYILWQSGNIISSLESTNITEEVLGDPGFYNYLFKTITVNSQIRRRVLGLDFTVLAGSSELADYYLTVNLNDNYASMGNIYSNIQNGRGIFSSSIEKNINNKFLSDNTIDSISYGRITRQLNFANHYGIFY